MGLQLPSTITLMLNAWIKQTISKGLLFLLPILENTVPHGTLDRKKIYKGVTPLRNHSERLYGVIEIFDIFQVHAFIVFNCYINTLHMSYADTQRIT